MKVCGEPRFVRRQGTHSDAAASESGTDLRGESRIEANGELRQTLSSTGAGQCTQNMPGPSAETDGRLFHGWLAAVAAYSVAIAGCVSTTSSLDALAARLDRRMEGWTGWRAAFSRRPDRTAARNPLAPSLAQSRQLGFSKKSGKLSRALSTWQTKVERRATTSRCRSRHRHGRLDMRPERGELVLVSPAQSRAYIRFCSHGLL